jgi:hypothetical protein
MNALLLKDLYLLARQNKLTAIFLVVFLLVGATGGTFYAVIVSIIAVMLPLSTLAYDQMHHWDRFAMALPIPRSMHVTEKYLLSCMMLVASIVLMLVIGTGFMIAGKTVAGSLLANAWTQTADGLFFIAVNYPIVIKLGFEGGRIWYVIITVPIVALGSLANTLFSLEDGFDHITEATFAFLLIPIIMVWLSHKLSVSFITHKEF